MQRIEGLATVSVGRGCGFAALGIATFVLGLLHEPDLAFRAGGLLFLLVCFTLLLRAWYARRRPYRSTELWIMLEPMERPQAAFAQQIISTALREAYLRFALHAAWLSLAMFSSSLLFGLSGAQR
jgi:hypothetical protein